MSISGKSEDEIRRMRKQHDALLTVARLHDTDGVPIDLIKQRFGWDMPENEIRDLFRCAIELDGVERLMKAEFR